MKQSTINRIINNYPNNTIIGQYSYNIQWHPMAGQDYIIRTLTNDIGKKWISWDGTEYGPWEWYAPIVLLTKLNK